MEPDPREAGDQEQAPDGVTAEGRVEDGWEAINPEPDPAENVSVLIVEQDCPIRWERHVTT
jgi:hypothetical protein